MIDQTGTLTSLELQKLSALVAIVQDAESVVSSLALTKDSYHPVIMAADLAVLHALMGLALERIQELSPGAATVLAPDAVSQYMQRVMQSITPTPTD